MSTVYDVLFKTPRLHRKLDTGREALARAIVASGKMRLDADNEANFARLLLGPEGINVTFTARELNEPKLLARSRERLVRLLTPKRGEQAAAAAAEQYIEKLRGDIKKRHGVDAQVELMMARALVMCNALPVIRLIHLEGAEIYISYGHSVGDMMDIDNWRQHGANSGLQAAGAGENAVYVSCGGHPFLDDKERRHTGDGPPALARFMIIAAQETGHNGDMIRTPDGRLAGRFSAVDWGRAPSERAGKGRREDLRRTEALYERCRAIGLRHVVEWERQLKFYRDIKVKHWRRTLAWCLARLGWVYLRLRMRQKGMRGVARLQRSAYPATQLRTFFPDMLFNLEPVADVYKRGSATEQEAVACIEALARVPQQVVKWGHAAVKECEPQLYALYYGTVVPACEAAAARYMR